MICRSVVLLIAFELAALPARAQLLQVTTTSGEARQHFEMGRRAAHHYQFAEAREHLDAAIAADTSFVLALLHRGGSAEKRSELQQYLQRANSNRGSASEGEQLMIDAFHAFLLDRNYDRAIEIFAGLSEEYPDDPFLPSYLGLRYYRNLGLYAEAADQFRRSLARDSSFVQAYNWLGHIAMDQGDYVLALETFERYVRLAPDLPRPHNSLGVLHLRQGELEKAAFHFEQASARDPRFIESRENLTRVRIAQTVQQLEAAFRQQDARAIASIYTEDGQVLPTGYVALEGREAIGQYWQKVLESGFTSVGFHTLEMYHGADSEIATEVGRYRFDAGIRGSDEGKYVFIWQRTPEVWKLHRDIRISDRPENK